VHGGDDRNSAAALRQGGLLNTKERSIKVVKELNDAASFIQSLQTDYCYLIKANNEITKARDIFAKENAVFKAENEALREFVEMFERLRNDERFERVLG